MSAPKLKVLRVGDGIAGPCLAYWFAKTHLDISVTIIEQSPSPRVTDPSIDIPRPAIDIVKRMKLEGVFRSGHTTRRRYMILWISSGNIFAQFRASAGDSFTAEYVP